MCERSKTEDNPCKLVLSYHHVSLKDWTQVVISLGSKHFTPSSHLFTYFLLVHITSLILFYVWVFCLQISVHCVCAWCPRRPEQGVESPGTESPDPMWELEIMSNFSQRTASALKHQTGPPPSWGFLKITFIILNYMEACVSFKISAQQCRYSTEARGISFLALRK